MTTITRVILTIFTALSLNASDLTLTTGIQVTPNKQATESDHVWNQESRIGPSAGIVFRKWFTAHQGIFVESNYGNTDTRLQVYSQNTWTMSRISLDGGYTYRWETGRLSEHLKAGVGSMVTICGMDTIGGSAGNDVRMEALVGAGLSYRLSRRFSAVLEYEGREIRNPDFTDHAWKPQRALINEPKIGIMYTFVRSR